MLTVGHAPAAACRTAMQLYLTQFSQPPACAAQEGAAPLAAAGSFASADTLHTSVAFLRNTLAGVCVWVCCGSG